MPDTFPVVDRARRGQRSPSSCIHELNAFGSCLCDEVALHHVVVLVFEDVAVPDVLAGERRADCERGSAGGAGPNGTRSLVTSPGMATTVSFQPASLAAGGRACPRRNGVTSGGG